MQLFQKSIFHDSKALNFANMILILIFEVFDPSLLHRIVLNISNVNVQCYLLTLTIVDVTNDAGLYKINCKS